MNRAFTSDLSRLGLIRNWLLLKKHRVDFLDSFMAMQDTNIYEAKASQKYIFSPLRLAWLV